MTGRKPPLCMSCCIAVVAITFAGHFCRDVLKGKSQNRSTLESRLQPHEANPMRRHYRGLSRLTNVSTSKSVIFHVAVLPGEHQLHQAGLSDLAESLQWLSLAFLLRCLFPSAATMSNLTNRPACKRDDAYAKDGHLTVGPACNPVLSADPFQQRLADVQFLRSGSYREVKVRCQLLNAGLRFLAHLCRQQ